MCDSKSNPIDWNARELNVDRISYPKIETICLLHVNRPLCFIGTPITVDSWPAGIVCERRDNAFAWVLLYELITMDTIVLQTIDSALTSLIFWFVLHIYKHTHTLATACDKHLQRIPLRMALSESLADPADPFVGNSRKLVRERVVGGGRRTNSETVYTGVPHKQDGLTASDLSLGCTSPSNQTHTHTTGAHAHPDKRAGANRLNTSAPRKLLCGTCLLSHNKQELVG